MTKTERAYRLRQAGATKEEIAEASGSSVNCVRVHLWRV